MERAERIAFVELSDGDARRGRDVRFEHVVLLRCVATDGGPKARGPRRCRQGPSRSDSGLAQCIRISHAPAERRRAPIRRAWCELSMVSSCSLLQPVSMKKPHRSNGSLPLSASQQKSCYSITSSASSCIELGITTPSAFAVFRLMTRSNLLICCTGSSPGFSPCRIRPT